MAKNVKEIMKGLPVSRRKKIKARAALLIAEEMTLQEMRKARELTQEKLAKSLGVNQKQVSAIEKRTDMHLSTLRRTVEKMGGRLTLVVRVSGPGTGHTCRNRNDGARIHSSDIRSAARARGQSLGACANGIDKILSGATRRFADLP
jgi:DNA-binding XRE family transcriptional regulator